MTPLMYNNCIFDAIDHSRTGNISELLLLEFKPNHSRELLWSMIMITSKLKLKIKKDMNVNTL